MKFKEVLTEGEVWNEAKYKSFCKKIVKDFKGFHGIDLDSEIWRFAEEIIRGNKDLKTYLEKLTKQKEMRWLKNRLEDDIKGAR